MKISLENLYRRYVIPYVKSEQAAGLREVDLNEAIEHARDAAFEDGYTEVPTSVATNIRSAHAANLLLSHGVGLHRSSLILEKSRAYWIARHNAHDHAISDESILYLPLAIWLQERYSGPRPVPFLTLTPWNMKDGRGGAPDVMGYPVFDAYPGAESVMPLNEVVAIDAKCNIANWNIDIGSTAGYRRFAHRAYLAYPLVHPVYGQAAAFFDSELQAMCRRLGIGLLAVAWPTTKKIGTDKWRVEVVVEADSCCVPPVECDRKIRNAWAFIANYPDTYELRASLRYLMTHMRRHLRKNPAYVLDLNTARLCCWQPAPKVLLNGVPLSPSRRMREAVLKTWVQELNRFRHLFQE